MAGIDPVQMQKFLGGIDYPIDKQHLIENAREKGADENVVQTLERLPIDRFDSLNDVREAVGRMV
jgi:hypothetical protein